MPFHVWLAAGCESDRLHSMERYLQLVAATLRSADISFTICRPQPWLGKHWIPTSIRRLLGYIDKYVIFPWVFRFRIRHASSTRQPLVHILDQGNAFYLPALSCHRPLITCHDFIAIRSALGLGAFSKPSLVQKLMLQCLRRAGAWICVSMETQRHALQLLRVPADRCPVVYNPIDPDLLRNRQPAEHGTPFLLHVGNSAWYKNRVGLLEIYHALRHLCPSAPRLLLAGQPLSAAESAVLRNLQLHPWVDFCLHPTDSALVRLYQEAVALVFPSIEEGFGWPPLEAMASGCPVFASARAPLTEIGGNAAEYFDPDDPEAAAALIANRLSLGPSWRNERARVGRARAGAFSTTAFTSGLLAVYQSMATHFSADPSAVP